MDYYRSHATDWLCCRLAPDFPLSIPAIPHLSGRQNHNTFCWKLCVQQNMAKNLLNFQLIYHYSTKTKIGGTVFHTKVAFSMFSHTHVSCARDALFPMDSSLPISKSLRNLVLILAEITAPYCSIVKSSDAIREAQSFLYSLLQSSSTIYLVGSKTFIQSK